MTPTTFQSKAGIRAAFVNFRTTLEDVAAVFGLMSEINA